MIGEVDLSQQQHPRIATPVPSFQLTRLETSNKPHMASDYRKDFKKLIIEVAAALQGEDCNRLAYAQDITTDCASPLDLLKLLEKKGIIGQSKVHVLSDMLDDITRSDLVSSKIEPFQKKYKQRHLSLPEGSSNPRLDAGRRFNTFSGLGSTEVLNEITDVSQQESFGNVSYNFFNESMESGLSGNSRKRSNTSTPLSNRPEGLPNTFSETRPRSRHVSEICKGGSTAAPSALLFHSTQGLNGNSHELYPPSHSHTQSDLSSTAAEMMQYNELENTFLSLIKPSEHSQEPSEHSVNEPVDPDIIQFDVLTSLEPGEDRVSYDQRFEGQIRRAYSVIPIEYNLINGQLHKMSGFHEPPDVRSKRRSFTPPASVPLRREAPLIAPSQARPGTTPLRNTETHDEAFSLTFPRRMSVPAPIYPVTNIQSFPRAYKIDNESQETSMSLQHKIKQRAFHHSGASSKQKSSSSNETLTSPVCHSMSPTAYVQSFEKETIKEVNTEDDRNHTDTNANADSPGKVRKRPGSGSRLARLKNPLIRTRSKLQNELIWSVKRNALNKAIYKHKENETMECPKRLELDVGHGHSANPKFFLILHPYGLEGDYNQNVTLEVYIEVPKKAPKMNSTAKVKLTVSVTDVTESRTLFKETMERSVLLREFYVHEFVSHKALKDSKSDTIEIKAQVEYIYNSGTTF